MAEPCGSYELVVDLKGEVVAAGLGFARTCRLAPEDLVGRPVTGYLRGPGLTAPYGQAANITIKTSAGDQPALALRTLDRDHLRITVLPTSGERARGGSRDDARRLHDVERLVAAVVHGICNPLTGIIGFASLSHLAPTARRRRYYLDQVATQAERARRLVSTLGAGVRQAPALDGTVDACETTARAVRGLRLQLEGHGISVDVALPPAAVWVTANDELLGDAVACFIRRGTLGLRRDYRAHEVAVSCRPQHAELPPAIRMAFSGCDIINDTLPGHLDPRQPSRSKSGPTLSDVELRAACDQLGQLGATLEIATSTDGEEVVVTLALSPATPPRQLDQTRTPVPLDILVIDDDVMMGELYSEVLAVSGHSVVSCRSLWAAREALRTQRFDAVIADLYLGDGTLPELWAEAAAAHPELRDRLIIVTGQRGDPRVRDWLSRGNLPVLTKPFTTTALLGRITELVS